MKTLYDIYSTASARRKVWNLLFKKVASDFMPITGGEFEHLARRIAALMKSVGVKRGDRVAVISYNIPEWHAIDYACTMLGVVSVPVYTTLTATQINFILKDSGAKLAFVQDAALAGVVTECMPVVIQGEGQWSFSKNLSGSPANFEPVNLSEDETATLMYTSGTTGDSKGVVLTHKNLVSNVLACSWAFQIDESDHFLSVLPLCHTLGRLADYMALYSGGTLTYAEDITRAMRNLYTSKPTLVALVPRMLEVLAENLRMDLKKGTPQEHLHMLVGGRLRYIISGGAALRPEVGQFLQQCGINVLEGYGLTETSPVIAVNRPGKAKFGTVGKPLDGVSVKLEDDGEIIVSGPNVASGYYNRPEETNRAFIGGWFHTGDIGEFDSEGYLKIVDRKKDIFKTSGGKYVAPLAIESKLKASGLIADAMVIGENRKYVAALLFVDFQRMSDIMRSQIESLVKSINSVLAPHEQIRSFEIVTDLPSVADGTLTPTFKLRRRVLEKRHAAVVERLFS